MWSRYSLTLVESIIEHWKKSPNSFQKLKELFLIDKCIYRSDFLSETASGLAWVWGLLLSCRGPRWVFGLFLLFSSVSESSGWELSDMSGEYSDLDMRVRESCIELPICLIEDYSLHVPLIETDETRYTRWGRSPRVWSGCAYDDEPVEAAMRDWDGLIMHPTLE